MNTTVTRRQFLQTTTAAGIVAASLPAFPDVVPVKPRFRIGVCDWMTGKSADPDCLRWCAEMGLDGAMVSFGGPGGKFDLRKPEIQQQFAENTKKYGTCIASLGMGVLNEIPYKSDPRTEEWVSDSIDVAKAVGVNVVLLAFFGKDDLKNDKAGTDETIRRLKRVAPKAEKAGVFLGVESWLSAEEHLHIIDSVGSPAITCYYDVGNSTKMGYDIFKEIRTLGTRNIKELHAKDYAGKLFGQGEIDFWELRRALDDINYSGWIQLEGPMPLGLLRSYAHDRHFLKAVFPPDAPLK